MVLKPLRKPACVSQRRVSERSVSSRGANTPAFLSGVSPDLCDPWLSPCLADGGFIPAIPSPIVKLQKQWSTQVVEQLATRIVFPRAQPRGLEFAWITEAVPHPSG